MINLFKTIKTLKNFKSKIFLFCSPAFRKLTADSYKLKAILSIFRNLKPKTYHLKPNQGFAMLFSVLISSLLVVIGLSIFNITLKELVISTSGRESQVAFYAANSGMECALYWDLKGNGLRSAFASTTGDVVSAQSVPALCNGVTVNSATSVTTNFSFDVTSNPNGPCVIVKISKNPDADRMTTTIESRGKNICGSSGGRKVERGLKATIITEI